jgi:GNAT superfamily N-acetyltransferase
VIELRDEPPDAPAARDLFEPYMALLAERLGQRFDEREDIFGRPDEFAGPGCAWLVVYEGGEPVACGGLRRVDAETGEVKRMFVRARARRRGHGRRLLAELERRARAAGFRRVGLITTEVLTEARALYAGAGYRVVRTPVEGERQDFWMEKELAPPS